MDYFKVYIQRSSATSAAYTTSLETMALPDWTSTVFEQFQHEVLEAPGKFVTLKVGPLTMNIGATSESDPIPSWLADSPEKSSSFSCDIFDAVLNFYYNIMRDAFVEKYDIPVIRSAIPVSNYGFLLHVIPDLSQFAEIIKKQDTRFEDNWVEILEVLDKEGIPLRDCSIPTGREIGRLCCSQTLKIEKCVATSQLLSSVVYNGTHYAAGVSTVGCYSNHLYRKNVVIGKLQGPLRFDGDVLYPRFEDDEVVHLTGATYHELHMGSNCVIQLSGSPVSIFGRDGNPAITASGVLTISGPGVLTVTASSMASCIGERTNYPQSYGRWTPAFQQTLETIRLTNGAHLVCLTKIPNFSLGAYGRDWIPEIDVSPGCSIKCPETESSSVKRILEKSGTHYDGSTKLTGEAVYAMQPVVAGVPDPDGSSKLGDPRASTSRFSNF